MKKGVVETSVGVFVVLGLICVGYLTIKLGKMEWVGDRYYSVSARFHNVAGLRIGAEVVMAGVEVGQVDDIHLDPDRLDAVVGLKIRKNLVLTDDVIASVKTAGLIGDKYIKLTPGGSEITLEPGGLITETESPIDLEEMISKYVFGGVK